jgi:ATP-dependent Zn protease
VRKIVESRMEGVIKTLRERQELLHRVAAKLLELETLEGDYFTELIGQNSPQEAAAS